MSMTETPLETKLKRLISNNGPITLAQYMGECLSHPKHGYYMNKDPFGEGGDFTTAPEISQMFGEMIGMWIANTWQAMSSPSPIKLIELGPGRGTLMADILRVLNIVPELKSNLSVHMVEMSPTLIETQKKSLASEAQTKITWHKNLSEIADGCSFIIANEFFDALPIHQFEKQDDRWCERRVHTADNELKMVLTAAGPKFALTNPALHDGPDGSILEVCPAGLSVAGSIAERLFAGGGAAIIIDYGYRKSVAGDSFQALKNHKFCDPLAEPGEADLTAHVAFDQIATAAKSKGASSFGVSAQGPFLMALGIGERAQQLAASTDQQGQERVLSELTRLTSGEEMGTLFKVLALQDPNLPAPPGF